MENRFSGTTVRELEARARCLDCFFWEGYETQCDDFNMVRIKGQHYVIGGEPGPGDFGPGFGGREFRIRFHDGRSVATRNFWHQGEIPERFRESLPDNATFETRKEDTSPRTIELPEVIVNLRTAGILHCMRAEAAAGRIVEREGSLPSEKFKARNRD